MLSRYLALVDGILVLVLSTSNLTPGNLLRNVTKWRAARLRYKKALAWHQPLTTWWLNGHRWDRAAPASTEYARI